MKEITVYRTYSYGGMELRDVVTRTFETMELATENAANDTWNDNFSLYEVTITFNGRVTEKENFIKYLLCQRDIKALEKAKEDIETAELKIKEHEANKKIKEETRKKRIDVEKRIIALNKRTIERIEKRC